MTSAKVEGYQRMLRNIQHFFRSELNAQIIDEQSIADAIWEAETQFTYKIAQGRVHWLTRRIQFDDSGIANFDAAIRQIFFKSDMGITDIIRPARLWRVDTSGNLGRKEIQYIDSSLDGARAQNPGIRMGSGHELWTETGDINSTTGRHERSIWIYNPGTALTGGELEMEYWFHPEQLTVDDLHEVDENGDFTKGPQLPEILWIPIMNYAKWVMAELAEEPSKVSYLQQRFGGRHGIDAQVESLLATAQTDDPNSIRDVYEGEY